MRALFFVLLAHAAGAAPAFRLPEGVRPLRQALDLTLKPESDRFSGVATIDLEIAAPTDVIWLHATDLQIDEARVDGAPAKVVIDGDFLGVAPAGKVSGKAQLVVRFRGGIDGQRSRGIYRQEEAAGQWYLYTNFEPIDARRAFPCFDEPAFKIPWELTFHVPADQVALGNAPVVATSAEPGGMKRVRLAPSKPLPSYLVALVVGPFELVDGGKVGRKKTPLRFVVPRGRAAETRYAREVTPRIVTLLEDYFDMPYPYEKLDVAVVPRYWGTMEHPGLVALGQTLTLIRPDEESLPRKQAYANIAIHELAHYWFGDYVTCRWWDDVWLNESFASWLDAKITDRLEPSWRWLPRHHLSRLARAFESDGLPGAHSLRLEVKDRDAIQNAFDSGIAYDKGAALIGMIEAWLGEEKLRSVMRRYLADHAWGNASAEDFLKALTDEGAGEIAAAFASFVGQPGVPLVEARCDKTPQLTLTQQRFRSKNGRWRIPVCVDAGGRRCTIVGEKSAQLPLDACPSQLFPNAGAAGYFRTKWSGAALRALDFGKRSAAERMLIADDVAALADEGLLPLGEALRLLPQLAADEDLLVFRRAGSLLWLLHPEELPADHHAAFNRAVEKLLGARSRALGWTPQAGEDPDSPAMRQRQLSLLGRTADDRGVRYAARAQAERWLADRQALTGDLVSTALLLSATDGDAAWFERLYEEGRHARDRREREQLLAALGGFRRPELLARALDLVANSELDLRETSAILHTALSDRVTRTGAWSWLQKHWDAVVSRMRDDESLWLIDSLVSSFCDPAHRKQLETFLTPRVQKRVGGPRALATALGRLDLCVAAERRNQTAVREFLSRY